MKYVKMLTSLSAAIASICFVANGQTNEWAKRTVLTVSAPIEIPGHVLPAGSYVMRLNDSASNRHIVEVYDKDQKHLITTILAIPNYRLQPTGKTVFTFWEVPQGQPKALRAWFYPGDNFGQEFAYPKQEATKIAASAHASVPTTSANSKEEFATASVTSTNESGASSELDRQAYTAPPQSSFNTPAQAAQATQMTQSNQAKQPTRMAQSDQGNQANQMRQSNQTAAPTQSSFNTPDQAAAQTNQMARSNRNAQNGTQEIAQTTRQRSGTLPSTATNLPLMGFVGLILVAFGLTTMLPIKAR